ncbi:hypothetical protein NXS19_000982 [Fusarium pseudograminearum]|nr:hypothetical protein NXS19_000982 [Fusarium pseudograminearum]
MLLLYTPRTLVAFALTHLAIAQDLAGSLQIAESCMALGSGGMPSATFAIFGEDITYLCLERDVNGRQSAQSTQARGSQSFQVALDLYERVFNQHPHEMILRPHSVTKGVKNCLHAAVQGQFSLAFSLVAARGHPSHLHKYRRQILAAGRWIWLGMGFKTAQCLFYTERETSYCKKDPQEPL